MYDRSQKRRFCQPLPRATLVLNRRAAGTAEGFRPWSGSARKESRRFSTGCSDWVFGSIKQAAPTAEARICAHVNQAAERRESRSQSQRHPRRWGRRGRTGGGQRRPYVWSVRPRIATRRLALPAAAGWRVGNRGLLSHRATAPSPDRRLPSPVHTDLK